MNSLKPSFTSVDEYIAAFPEAVQTVLQVLRATIKAAAPDAIEKISYQMPTYVLNGNLVYFGAWKHHIGFYPWTSGIEAFKDELSGCEVTAGTVKFWLDRPLPLELITRIVQFRVAENMEKAALKASKAKTAG